MKAVARLAGVRHNACLLGMVCEGCQCSKHICVLHVDVRCIAVASCWRVSIRRRLLDAGCWWRQLRRGQLLRLHLCQAIPLSLQLPG